jgi:hypothetical protein
MLGAGKDQPLDGEGGPDQRRWGPVLRWPGADPRAPRLTSSTNQRWFGDMMIDAVAHGEVGQVGRSIIRGRPAGLATVPSREHSRAGCSGHQGGRAVRDQRAQ